MIKPRINFYPIIRSIAGYVLPKNIMNRPGSGGTFSSKYCYSVWLRHLHYLIQNNLFKHPSEIKKIAELGPGDSLGIGMAAMYTGAENYYALDVIPHANQENNLKINDQLCEYFTSNLEIPHGMGFEFTSPIMDDYKYPETLKSLNSAYFKHKKKSIDLALSKTDLIKESIEYIVPWNSQPHNKLNDSIDLIFSQAVMEHVDEVQMAYDSMFRWLKKGGVMSHQIDFKTHEMTKEWNGHWFVNQRVWKFLLDGRKYPINRLPLSSHIEMMKNSGFEIKNVITMKRDNPLKNKTPKVPEVIFSSQDLVTSGALIQAIKNNR